MSPESPTVNWLLKRWGNPRWQMARLVAALVLGALVSLNGGRLLAVLGAGFGIDSFLDAENGNLLFLTPPIAAILFRLLAMLWYPAYVYVEEGPYDLRRKVQCMSHNLQLWHLFEGGLVLSLVVYCAFEWRTLYARSLVLIPSTLAIWLLGLFTARRVVNRVALACGGALSSLDWRGTRIREAIRSAGFHDAREVYDMLRTPVARYGLTDLQMSIELRNGVPVPMRGVVGMRMHQLLEIWLALGSPPDPSTAPLKSGYFRLVMLNGPQWPPLVTDTELRRMLSHLPRELTSLAQSLGRGMTYRLVEDVVQETGWGGHGISMTDKVRSTWVSEGSSESAAFGEQRGETWKYHERASRVSRVVYSLRERDASFRRIARKVGMPATAVANIVNGQ